MRLGWVKAHVGISSRQREGRSVGGSEWREPQRQMTEGAEAGVEEEEGRGKKVKGAGMGRVVRWNWKARVSYAQCRTGKGNLQAW